MNLRRFAVAVVVTLIVSATTLLVNGPTAYGAALVEPPPHHVSSTNPNLITPPGGGYCPSGYQSYNETYSGNQGTWTTQLYVTFHYPGNCTTNVTVSFQTCWRDNQTNGNGVTISVGLCDHYSNGSNMFAEEDFTVDGENGGGQFSTYQTISTDQYGNIHYYQHPYS